MIRELTISELPLIYRVGKEFYEEAKLPGRFVNEVFLKTWTGLLKSEIGHCFGAFKDDEMVGALGCMILNDMYDGALVTLENFWYVFEAHRGQGVRLMKHYENWARENGAKRIMMGAIVGLHHEELGDFYERNGYRPLERTHVLEL